MEIHEFVDEGLGHSSYLVPLDGTALVVDPPRFPAAIELRADDVGVSIAWTADTHSHADYVTGSPALAARTGATFLAPAASNLETSHQPLGNDEVIELTGVYSLRALATPGHTPDHMAYLLCRDGAPVALFSGGSLMVGTVGRTDLCGPDLAEPLAHEMFTSLHRFDDLADELAVYPTHGAGSFCGAPGGAARTTTLGTERTGNPLLAIGDEDKPIGDLLRPRDDGRVLRSSSVHQAKGSEMDAVLVTLPRDRRPSTRTADLVSDWEGGLNTEARRVLYVAVTRARRLCAIAVPQTQLGTVERVLRAGSVSFTISA